jgi:DNA polymerase I-like protein with 3'-5' exonuclease and polymerase domains
VIFIDTETRGLDCRSDQLTAVGIAFNDSDPIVLRHPDDRDLIQQVLELEETFTAHNATFDFGFLESSGYAVPDPSRWVDTVVVAHVGGARKPGQARLDALQKQLVATGELPSEILEPEQRVKAWLTSARRQAKKDGRRRPEKGDAPPEVLYDYLCADVVSTRAVARHWSALADGQTSILELERACLGAIFCAERRGVPLDLDAARELRDRTDANVRDLRVRMFELAGRTFNPNAARQIEKVLVERDADLTSVPRTPKADMPMFTEQTLAAIDDELARALESYRDEKSLSDYVHNLFEHAHGDRLYGTFRQVGTETGRMSSGRPNLQNIPKRDLRVRYVIRAAAGRVLVGADLDNVELRVLAAYAPGGRLERAFADGIDLHQQTADACGVDRDMGKRLNYLIVYGGGVQLVQNILAIDHAEARAILDRWYGLYPEVSRLKARLMRTVRRRGYLVSILGRRHHFDQPNHMLLNRLISGSCADLFKRSIVELHRAGAPMILFVHDEIVCDVDQDDADRVAKLLETELTRAAIRPGVRIDRLVASATVAERWSDFKEPGWAPEPGAPFEPATQPPAPPEQLLLGEDANQL